MQLLPTPSALGAHIGGDPIRFRRDLLQHKTRVPGLSCGVLNEIICLVVLILPACDGQTDGRMDRHMMTANTVLA